MVRSYAQELFIHLREGFSGSFDLLEEVKVQDSWAGSLSCLVKPPQGLSFSVPDSIQHLLLANIFKRTWWMISKLSHDLTLGRSRVFCFTLSMFDSPCWPG